MVTEKVGTALNRPSSIVALVAGSLSLLLGSVVLLGWYSHNTLLIQVLPTFVPMQYNTALGFFLSGLSVAALFFNKRRVAMVSGGIVGLIGLLTLIEYMGGVNLGIDELFMDHYVMVKTSHPGRMAPNTALCFLLTGAALVSIGRSPSARMNIQIGGILGALVLGLGTVAFTGYLVQLETAYGWGHLTRMAVHTAGGFIDLGIGLMALAWAKRSSERLVLPDWFPVAIAIVVVTVSIALWQAMHLGSLQEEGAGTPTQIHNLAHHLFLVFGVFLAAALSLSAHLAQSAHDRTRSLARANNSLRESEEKFRSMSEAVNDAVILVDHEGRVSFWNSAAEHIFGYSAPEIIGTPPHETIVPERYHEGLHRKFPEFQKTGQGPIIGRTTELTALRKDGTEFPVEVSLSSIQRNGNWWAVGVIRDISGRKEMESNLLRAQKLSAISNMISGIAHELNNMLLPIQSLTNITAKNLPEDSRDRVRLTKVSEAAQRATETVQKLVEFTRWGEPKFEELLVVPFMKDVIEDLRSTIPLSITVDIEESDAVIRGDKSQLHGVIFNIVDNAVDAMEGRTGDLILKVAAVELAEETGRLGSHTEPGRYIRLTIQDCGIGMDADTVSKVFDPFFTTKPVGQGTGLGLSTAYGIVTQHGGAIAVESAPGQGSTFDVYLPVLETREH